MLIYGRNTILQALESPFEIVRLEIDQNIKSDEKINNILSVATNKKIPINYTNRSKLSQKTRNDEHQGIIGDINFKYSTLRDLFEHNSDNAYLYISEATFEHNIGAIIRTAECLGISGVLLPKDINITSTIAKISTGAVFHIPIIQSSIYQSLKEFKDNGYKTIGIERNGNKYFESDLTGKILFIIGGEDKSLSENLRIRCDEIVEIPQFGNTNSLNMSVAAGIVMGEYLRQKLST